MTLGIVTSGIGWHVRDLLRAAEELRLSANIIEFNSLQRRIGIDQRDPLDDCDTLLIRSMPLGSLEQVIFRIDALHEREQAGVRVLNAPKCLEVSIDKYLTLMKLRQAGLPVPRTHVSQTAEQAMEGFASLGNDAVVKPIFGSEGRGILRVSDADLAWRTFKTLERTQAVIYQQEFIRHPGYDVRAFVLNGKVLAAMKRSNPTNWRTNASLGAKCEPMKLSALEEGYALRSAKAVGAWAVGVDLLNGPNSETFVIEVNAVPGWKAIAPACEADVAKEMLRSIVDG